MVLVVFTAGCATLGIEKPKPLPKVTHATNGWAIAKALYGANLQLFTNYAVGVCPDSQCGDDVPLVERKLIATAQNVHTNALEVVAEGDAISDGNYASVVARLNALAYKLTKRAVKQ